MTVDHYRLRSLLNDHPYLTRPAKTLPAVVASIASSLDKSKMLLHDETIETGIQFALWSDLWNKYGTYGTNRKTFRDKAFRPGRPIAKGTVLEVDFGHFNIDPEFSYGHPAIVVADHHDLVVVAPVTTDRGQLHLRKYLTAVISISASTYPVFDHDSLVLIHQTRSVGKNRIYGKLGSIAGTPLMDAIEEQYLERHSTVIGHQLKKQIKELKQTVSEQEKMIAELQEQLSALSLTPQMVAPTKDHD